MPFYWKWKRIPELASLSKEDRLALVQESKLSGKRWRLVYVTFILLVVGGGSSLVPMAMNYGGIPLMLVAALFATLLAGWLSLTLGLNLMRPKMREVLKSRHHSA